MINRLTKITAIERSTNESPNDKPSSVEATLDGSGPP